MGNKKDPKVKVDAYRYRQLGKVPKAIECFQSYLRINPRDIVAALDLGELFMLQEQFPEACKVYAKILEFEPKHVIAASNLGGALLRSGRANDAKDLLLYALELDPKNVHARINLGGAYQALGDRKANLDNALQAVGLDPSNALAFNNLGSALTDMAMFKEAKHAYETAVMLDPKQVDALINLAGTEARLGQPARAVEMYEKVLTLLPAQEQMRAEAVKFYAAFEYLKQGKLEKGWEYYDGGFSLLVPLAGARSPRRTFAVPRWDGNPLNGKTLLVWREQGLGDELLFYTCLHELKEMGGNIIVECDKRLVEVMARSFPEFTIRAEIFLPQQEGRSPHSDFDFHLPAGSLMRHFRPTLESFNRSGAYIKPDPAKVAKFQERLAPYKDDYRLVGICWRSGKLDPVRNLSYTPLDDWGEILQTPGMKFVNLQYGECEAELKEAEEKYGIEILRWPDLDLRNDLDGTFALMECLDAIFSVQTAVLTMAGAIGKSSIGLKSGGWPMLGRKSTNPFFPTQLKARDPEKLLESFSESLVKRSLTNDERGPNSNTRKQDHLIYDFFAQLDRHLHGEPDKNLLTTELRLLANELGRGFSTTVGLTLLRQRLSDIYINRPDLLGPIKRSLGTKCYERTDSNAKSYDLILFDLLLLGEDLDDLLAEGKNLRNYKNASVGSTLHIKKYLHLLGSVLTPEDLVEFVLEETAGQNIAILSEAAEVLYRNENYLQAYEVFKTILKSNELNTSYISSYVACARKVKEEFNLYEIIKEDLKHSQTCLPYALSDLILTEFALDGGNSTFTQYLSELEKTPIEYQSVQLRVNIELAKLLLGESITLETFQPLGEDVKIYMNFCQIFRLVSLKKYDLAASIFNEINIESLRQSNSILMLWWNAFSGKAINLKSEIIKKYLIKSAPSSDLPLILYYNLASTCRALMEARSRMDLNKNFQSNLVDELVGLDNETKRYRKTWLTYLI